MAQKKITDLELRSSFDETVSVPVDDTTQTYRCTGDQINTFLKPNYQKNIALLKNVGLSVTASAGAMTVALKQADGTTNPVATDPNVTEIVFRSNTLTSGARSRVSFDAALSIVIPSTATMGYASGDDALVYVYAYSDGSNKGLIVSTQFLNEDSLYSTTAISAAATTGIYADAIRTLAAVRLIGKFQVSAIVTAGTWTTPTSVATVPFSQTKDVTTLSVVSNEIRTPKGTDYSTTGTSNNVSTSGRSLLRYTGASTATFTGFANGADGKHFTIVNASSSDLTINNNDSGSTAANRIKTGTGVAITIPADASLSFKYDSGASFWRVINGPTVALTDWVSFTPTGAWTANCTYTGMWRRVGDSAQYMFEVICSGAPTTATLTFVLPSGHVIDTAKLTATTVSGASMLPASGAHIKDGGSNNYPATVRYNTTTNVVIWYHDDAASGVIMQAVVTQAAPFTFGSSDYVTAYFTVPIVGWSAAGR